MPRRDDLRRIMILGSGPIVIGQAAEFDYSGVQACKVLREEGYEVVLVNSNPATIMTDPEFADATYVEPLRPEVVSADHREGAARRAPADARRPDRAEHRDGPAPQRRARATRRGAHRREGGRDRARRGPRHVPPDDGARPACACRAARSRTTLAEAEDALIDLGLPIVVRPAYTLGGRGGGIARTPDEFRRIVAQGIEASPISQVLLDESVLGWGEFELEVMRDHNDNVVIVCSIENIDPMGVHTGDSVTVAPQQTLPDRLYQKLRDQAIAVIRAVGVETGGSNVQFAVNPATEEVVVIEMNPRVSRSSALASKATGFPIAKIAAKLAVGYALEEIDNDITKLTPASFEPTIDYVVVKWPRFAFEKFAGADEGLTTHMKSVGEAMAIGRTFKQAFAKAMRSRELDAPVNTAEDDLLTRLEIPSWDRYDVLQEAFRRGATPAEVHARTSIDLWFLRELQSLALDPDEPFRGERVYRSVDTCAAEFPASTPYFYSGWERSGARHEVRRGDRPSVVILGSGPNRIGQGIEFDYCCVHAAMTVRASGRDAVMVNCNPETVSTDYDTSDRLYFEPLTLEDVLAVVEVEAAGGRHRPVRRPDAAQARGGPAGCGRAGARHLGRRDRPGRGPRALRRPAGPARAARPAVGDGALRRGRDRGQRAGRLPAARAAELRPRRPGDGDRLLHRRPARLPRAHRQRPGPGDLPGPLPGERDRGRRRRALRRRSASGSAASCSTSRRPACTPATAPASCRRTRWAARCSTRSAGRREGLAMALGVVGLVNVQYAVADGALHVIEANPRASRTVPFVSKAIGVPLAKMACRLMLGERLEDLDLPADPMRGGHVSVKEAVLPFDRFAGSDAVLGPEMRSTGEVMGIALDFPTAFAKAQAAAGSHLPTEGTVFITVTDSDKPGAGGLAVLFSDLGFRIVATQGTADAIRGMGVRVDEVLQKIGDGSPNVVDGIERGEVDLVINTPTGSGARTDGWEIRRAAVARGIPCITTLAGGMAAARAIAAGRTREPGVLSLQEIHRERLEV